MIGVFLYQVRQAVKHCPRSAAAMRRQGALLSKAARAAFTARFTSAASASAMLQISSPVAGLMVANCLPEKLSTHCSYSLFAILPIEVMNPDFRKYTHRL